MDSVKKVNSQSAGPGDFQKRSESCSAAKWLLRHFGYGRILDVGAGDLGLVAALVREGVDAHGYDCSPEVNSHRASMPTERLQTGSVLHLPYGDNSFDTVHVENLLESLAPEDIPLALRELRRVTRRNLVLKITLGPAGVRPLLRIGGSRAWWEKAFFEAGLRKHTEYYAINDYGGLQYDGEQIIVPLEKIPDAALAEFPLERLAEEIGQKEHLDATHVAVNFGEPGKTRPDP